jgi:hypothetical protein
MGRWILAALMINIINVSGIFGLPSNVASHHLPDDRVRCFAAANP